MDPPTSTTWSMFFTSMPASLRTARTGFLVRSNKSAVICSNCERDKVSSKCNGPSALAVMYGKLIDVDIELESSIFAFSAASRRRCIAILSFDKSTPCAFLNDVTIQSTTALSQSSPPRWLSPLVALTSTTPSPISRSETSKVPPPRSKTKMVCSMSPLSRP